MQIKNIEKKIRATKEKTEVLGGRISTTKIVAFNMIAEALDVSTAELFKATIDECIESFFKSMLKIDIQKARMLVDERLDKAMKKKEKNTFTFRDYTKLSDAEQKIIRISNMAKSFPREIPLFWLFDDIKLDFNRETENVEKERWMAYKKFLDEIEEKENKAFNHQRNHWQEQNSQIEDEIKQNDENREIVNKYYNLVNNNKKVPKELEEKFAALDPETVKTQELLQYPFVKDELGHQKYSDEEILKAVNNEMGENRFRNIQEVCDYAEKRIYAEEERQKKFEEKLKVIGAKEGEYDPSVFENIEEDPFGLAKSFFSEQKLPDEMIVRYWKYYLKDLEYFIDKDFTVENIKAYTILKHDGVLN